MKNIASLSKKPRDHITQPTMQNRRFRYARQQDQLIGLVVIVSLMGALIACSSFFSDAGGPPFNAATVNVVANTSLKPWLDGVVPAFNNSGTKTSDGKTAYVQITYVEAGQAVIDIIGGKSNP